MRPNNFLVFIYNVIHSLLHSTSAPADLQLSEHFVGQSAFRCGNTRTPNESPLTTPRSDAFAACTPQAIHPTFRILCASQT